jgi:glycosyltransferase involved in cell wall biosynthesis
MKILWVKSDFLHPTTRGGQIRTLEMLRCLRKRHEIRYVAFADLSHPEAVEQSLEYCHHPSPVWRRVPQRGSPRFWAEALLDCCSELPLAIGRYRSAEMEDCIQTLLRQERFDRAVCDFLVPSCNIPDVSGWVLFQHNVETVIWERLASRASDPVRRFYYGLQARRMLEYEGRVCRQAGHVVAVSEPDARVMQERLGVAGVSTVPTGVDVEFFKPPRSSAFVADLAFVGSMDWFPNTDAVEYFVGEILPRIRRRRPGCSLAIVGRRAPAQIRALARRDPKIVVTGTVADVRPFLWGSTVGVVPLRIGGGTRLKIYELMAARVPVVSTTVGAEGLDVSAPENLLLADTAQDFADRCVDLLANAAERARIAASAWEVVRARFSWEQVATRFERILEATDRSPSGAAGTSWQDQLAAVR